MGGRASSSQVLGADGEEGAGESADVVVGEDGGVEFGADALPCVGVCCVFKKEVVVVEGDAEATASRRYRCLGEFAIFIFVAGAYLEAGAVIFVMAQAEVVIVEFVVEGGDAGHLPVVDGGEFDDGAQGGL